MYINAKHCQNFRRRQHKKKISVAIMILSPFQSWYFELLRLSNTKSTISKIKPMQLSVNKINKKYWEFIFSEIAVNND